MPTKSPSGSRRRTPGTARGGPRNTLAFLSRLAAEFTVVLSLPDLLDRTIRVLGEEIGFDSCTIGLAEWRNSKDVLVMRSGSGQHRRAKGLVLPRRKALVWDVIDTGTPRLVRDLHAASDLPRGNTRVRSGIYAPLIAGDRTIGVISAYRAKVGAFSEPDLHLLTIVARYIVGAVEVARLHEHLGETAATDGLTGLTNRRHFIGRLASEVARSTRTNRPLTVVLVDLNGFKAINDRFGYGTGDQVLIHIAQAIQRNVRAGDLVGRYNADEFALLLPETDASQAETLLARLTTPEILLLKQRQQLDLSLCWGISTWPVDGQNPDQLLLRADTRLNEMKRRRTH